MFGLITRRRHEAELAAARAEAERLRDERDQARSLQETAEFNRGQALAQAASVGAENRNLQNWNRELVRRVGELTAAGPEQAAALQRQVDQLLAENREEKKRGDRLQQRLDDAVGLKPSGIEDSSRWQPGYQKPKGATA
ncbi:hypothetical protein ABZ330_00190 [Streptomyces sp. NPDC006172]|uniref:hypothetical protein n=1 Tax=Streptomyces sp. NPDC006172 TaxID=3154470 RepID=UPI0033D90AE6